MHAPWREEEGEGKVVLEGAAHGTPRKVMGGVFPQTALGSLWGCSSHPVVRGQCAALSFPLALSLWMGVCVYGLLFVAQQGERKLGVRFPSQPISPLSRLGGV